jgi:hypothetical protein
MHQFDVDLTGLTIHPPNRNEYRPAQVLPTIVPLAGQPYHLLMVTYTTGNSFGRDSEPRYECVDLYVDKARAHDMARRIRKDLEQDSFAFRRLNKKPEPLVLIFANGVEEKRDYWPWKGHFERVEEIAVIEVTYSNHPKKVTF